jgi:hypothetical protein
VGHPKYEAGVLITWLQHLPKVTSKFYICENTHIYTYGIKLVELLERLLVNMEFLSQSYIFIVFKNIYLKAEVYVSKWVNDALSAFIFYSHDLC